MDIVKQTSLIDIEERKLIWTASYDIWIGSALIVKCWKPKDYKNSNSSDSRKDLNVLFNRLKREYFVKIFAYKSRETRKHRYVIRKINWMHGFKRVVLYWLSDTQC